MLSVIVALSENNVVGRNNALPWKLSADLRRVKALTMGHHIIMGRKTYESIGKPLPGRINVVVSRNKDFRAEGCIVTTSLKSALELSKNDNEVFVFGGGEIFSEALPFAQKIYMTRVHTHLEGDTVFSEPDPAEWKINSCEKFKADEKNHYDYSFIVMERITASV